MRCDSIEHGLADRYSQYIVAVGVQPFVVGTFGVQLFHLLNTLIRQGRVDLGRGTCSDRALSYTDCCLLITYRSDAGGSDTGLTLD